MRGWGKYSIIGAYSEKRVCMMKRETIRKIAAIIVLLALCALGLAVYARYGSRITNLMKDPERLRMWMERYGWKSRLIYAGIVCAQVIVAMIPGEPLELAGGYMFGGLEGTILCMAGIALGSAIVFGMVRLFGRKLVELFFSREKIESLRARMLRNPKRLVMMTVVLMTLPGTPKDLLTYCAGLTPISFGTWMLISTVCRIPSVVTSTVGGGAMGNGDYLAAAIVFAIAALLCLGGLWVYAGWKTGKDK